MSRAEAVDEILNFGRNPGWSPPAVNGERTWEYANSLARFWVERWATIPRPFEMKLLLFFHSHLTVNSGRLKHADQMHEYLTILQANQLADYRTMVKQVAVSPAMLQYLDNYRNRVGRPNENFARENFEIHLLGTGSYTQQDVVEAARAWTGHTLDEDRRFYRFDASQHDDREKTILGVRRRWDGPLLIDHVFYNATLRERAARHLVGRLWHFLTAAQPPAAVHTALANTLLQHDFALRPMIRALLLREEFLTGVGRTPIPRPPLEYAADLHRVTGLDPDETNPQWRLRQMGQMPFNPPNPAGWEDFEAFISASAFLTRASFIRNLAWKANGDTNFLEGIDERTPGDSVGIALGAFGVAEASAANRRILEDYVVRERGERGWAERVNLITTIALSPDVQVG